MKKSFLFLMIFTISACTTPNGNPSSQEKAKNVSETTKVAETLQVISSGNLVSKYKANEVKANQEFKDKEVAVTGRVASIAESFGSKYVVLGSELEGVQCMFPDSREDEIAKLSKGEKVVIAGTVTGMVILNVMMEDCRIYTKP